MFVQVPCACRDQITTLATVPYLLPILWDVLLLEFFCNYLFWFVCAYVHVHACTYIKQLVSVGSLSVDSGDQIQLARLGGKCLYPLNSVSCPHII